MPPDGTERTIPASKRPQTHALDHVEDRHCNQLPYHKSVLGNRTKFYVFQTSGLRRHDSPLYAPKEHFSQHEVEFQNLMPVEDSNYAFSPPDTTSKIQVKIGGNIASCLISPIVRLQFHVKSASAAIKKLSAPTAWKTSWATGSL